MRATISASTAAISALQGANMASAYAVSAARWASTWGSVRESSRNQYQGPSRTPCGDATWRSRAAALRGWIGSSDTGTRERGRERSGQLIACDRPMGKSVAAPGWAPDLQAGFWGAVHDGRPENA